MNIFLVPYTWLRHLQVALFVSGMALLGWWALLSVFVLIGPFWSLEWDGALLMVVMAGSVAVASTLGEGLLRRRKPLALLSSVLLSGGVSGGLAFAWYWAWGKLSVPILFSSVADDATDASLVSLRYRLGAFALSGLCASIGPIIVRKGAGLIDHLVAGVASGLAAAAVWHLCNFTAFFDLYLAGALAALTWGGVFGLLAWGIPDELYAGWIRVLSDHRHGMRIPVDALDRSPKERFVGHFPRGLDLWIPVEEGVLELHASVAVDAEQNYRARGLTLAPTTVRRFLERIDIRYDPRRPAPLETRLSSGDRVELGEGDAKTVVEFLMLPREEK